MNLREYFESTKTDVAEIYLTDNFHIFIQKINNDLCIEICDKNGNSKNILCDVSLNTDTLDIKETIVNAIFGNYLYK